MVAGFAGEAGVIANASSLATHDGEEVEHIAMLINGRLVIGTFEWIDDLNVGDHVKLVVSETPDGPLVAHAILPERDQLLWTPLSIEHTCHGLKMHAIKLGLVILAGTWMIFGSFCLFGDRPNAITLLYIFGFSVAMVSFVLCMSIKDMMHFGDLAEDIFRALNVPKSERFRIRPYSVLNRSLAREPNMFKKGQIFHFSDALAAHKKKFHLA